MAKANSIIASVAGHAWRLAANLSRLSLSMKPEEITIAITVYDRRDFVLQAIESALAQTIPVKVIVVEDCGPDASLRAFIESRFGSTIRYYRNPRRRGLFDNWNACLDYCETPWLSILHDDDYLRPEFVAEMLKLHQAAPDCGIYFGNVRYIDPAGATLSLNEPGLNSGWHKMDLPALADNNTLGFPGHLFRKDLARELGGFRATSRYAGDWEMWFALAACNGGAQAGAEVAVMRNYSDPRRGTSRISRQGENFLATVVQRKRNYGLLGRLGLAQRPSADELRRKSILTAKFMLWHGLNFSPRLLDYNARLFLLSPPQSLTQRALQLGIRCLGPRLVRWMAHGLKLLAPGKD
jgi:glycosyltransferase involved in cell wall biosynthesis